MSSSSSSSATASSGGVSVFGLLGVAFVVLKLVGVIHWPWLWVLAPFWIGLALALIVIISFLMFLAVTK